MIKEIKYGGFTANPDDHGSIEGDLAVAMNLIPEDGTVKPVIPPADVFQIPGGGTIMCLHKTSSYTHYIMHQSGNNALYLLHDDGGMPYDGGMIHQFGEGVEIHKVEPVGNTLVVLASDSVHYILWRNGSYHYLGNHLPELDLQFSMDEHSMTIFSDERDLGQITYTGNFFEWVNDPENKETLDRLRQAIMASANQVVGKLTGHRVFCFPFFVRYAFRLYDGDSFTMHSAPCLMVPTMDKPEVDMGWTIFVMDGPLSVHPKVKAKFSGYGLWCRGNNEQARELAQWSDIITSVDIFISPQFYTYNQNPKDDDIIIGSGSNYNQPPDNTQLQRQIAENGNFFLLRQIPVRSDPNQQDQRLRSGGGEVEPDFDPSNENIVTRERMTDDNGTHDELLADKSYVYNNRINLAGVSKRLFRGFSPALMWVRKDITQTPKRTTATVVVDTDGREIALQSKEALTMFGAGNSVIWFYYPNAVAKRAYLDVEGDIVELELMPHPTLNGAYYCSLDENAVQQSVDSVPTPSTDEQRLVALPNKVYTSEVNNPFYFPATGINSVGTGEIIGICAAVKAMSQGQFGQFPLYAFTTEGVWALQPGENGGYLSVHPVSRDVCLPSASITQLDDSVLFTSARGIMLISGSQVQCISEALHDKGMLVGSMNDNINLLAGLNGIGSISIDRFNTFLQGCCMLYDYAGQRIIVYNPGYSYAYIYSLQSHKWGMTTSSIRYTINSYPDALAVTSDNELVNYSDRVNYDAAPAASQLLLTRPLTLDQPDVLKTVDTVLQRGMFHKRAKHVQCVLYGSRDLYNWRVVASSKDENLRGFRGTPYQWFRIGLLLRLEPGESITGCTIQFEPRQTNRLR